MSSSSSSSTCKHLHGNTTFAAVAADNLWLSVCTHRYSVLLEMLNRISVTPKLRWLEESRLCLPMVASSPALVSGAEAAVMFTPNIVSKSARQLVTTVVMFAVHIVVPWVAFSLDLLFSCTFFVSQFSYLPFSPPDINWHAGLPQKPPLHI